MKKQNSSLSLKKPHDDCAIVIPARWGSTRFPGKALHLIAGRPLLQHVWERCLRVPSVKKIVIATDDRRIKTVAEHFGAEVMMTSKRHQSGTDRMAEVAEQLEKKRKKFTHFINVQGDEPLINVKLVDRIARTMLNDPKIEIITAATPLQEASQLLDSNLVKVVVNCHHNALYFSRAAIPFHRDLHDFKSAVKPLLHLGIYGFRRDILKAFVTYRPSPLERCEKLEQLRALEHGIMIRILTTSHRALGVDTPEDARRIELYFKK